MDVRKMFDPSKWLSSVDLVGSLGLNGKDLVVTIESVSPGEVTGEGGKKARKPIIRFVGKSKPLAINKTIAKAIIGMYGAETDAWRGKRVALYVTTTEIKRNGKVETVECIRVRPSVPRGKADETPEPAEPAQPQTEPGWTDGEPPPDVVLPTLADQKEPRQ